MNTAKSEVQYQLSIVPSKTAYPGHQDGVNAEQSTSNPIKLSQSSFNLGPGQNTSVDISASDPEGLFDFPLPVWSGYVKIQELGSANKSLTVPYLGLSGSLRSMTVIQNPGYLAVRNRERPSLSYTRMVDGFAVVPNPPSTNSTNSVPGRVENFWLGNIYHGSPFAFFTLAIGTPQLEVYVVPLDICQEQSKDSASLNLSRAGVPEASLSEVGGIKSLGLIADYVHEYRGRGDVHNGIEFRGLLESGQWAPPGRYKFAARALGVFGDPDNAAHWQQVQETEEFIFAYEGKLEGV